ncbi:MAG: carbohydrate ABC transporter permease [Sphaerochaeta sp.]
MSTVQGLNKCMKNFFTHIILIFFTIILLAPIGWAISSSFKPIGEIFKFPMNWIPENPTLNNYIDGWRAANFSRYFLNSIIVTLISTISVLLFCSMAGYSISKFNYPGKRTFFAFVIATMMIPIQVRVVPLYLIIQRFGWINTYAGLIAPVMVTSIGIFTMVQFISVIPKDLIASGRIDGAGEITIFFKIIIPVSKSGLAGLAIINYMAVWNDYFWPLVVVSRDRMRTIPLGLDYFLGEYFTNYGQFFALSMIVILPMVIVFLIFQRQFIDSAMLSGMKS